MWIYNGTILINIETGVSMRVVENSYRATFQSDFDCLIEHRTPSGAVIFEDYPCGEFAINRIYFGMRAECNDYLGQLAHNLKAQELPAQGTRTEPEPLPEPQPEPPYVPADCSDIPF